MSIEVLLALVLGFASFVSGRLQASSKEGRQKVGEGLLISNVLLFWAVYLPLYGGELWWIGFFLLAGYLIGIFGKDSVKLPLRNNIRPRIKKQIGSWEHPPKAQSNDDHSDVGIGS